MFHLTTAREFIGKNIGNREKRSGVFVSKAWGYNSDHLFYNCCLSVVTHFAPLPLMEELLLIEEAMGRARNSGGYTDRLIDIDLLFYGEAVVDHPRLQLPHPKLAERRFVLEPLVEIAPDLIHPVHGLTVREMLERCPDEGAVRSL